MRTGEGIILAGGITIVLVLFIAATYVRGYERGYEDGTRTQAIKAGVARYVADPATGAVKFEYIRGEGK